MKFAIKSDRSIDKNSLWQNRVEPFCVRKLKDGKTAYDFDRDGVIDALGYGEQTQCGHDYMAILGRNGGDWKLDDENKVAAMNYLLEAARDGSVTVLSNGVVDVYHPSKGEFDMGLDEMHWLSFYKDSLVEEVFHWNTCYENYLIYKAIRAEEEAIVGRSMFLKQG